MFSQSIVVYSSLLLVVWQSLSLSPIELCTIQTSTNSCVFNQRKGEREGIRENRTINRTLRKYFWKSARNHHKNIGQSDRVADRYLVKKWKGGKTILFCIPIISQKDQRFRGVYSCQFHPSVLIEKGGQRYCH